MKRGRRDSGPAGGPIEELAGRIRRVLVAAERLLFLGIRHAFDSIAWDPKTRAKRFVIQSSMRRYLEKSGREENLGRSARNARSMLWTADNYTLAFRILKNAKIDSSDFLARVGSCGGLGFILVNYHTFNHWHIVSSILERTARKICILIDRRMLHSIRGISERYAGEYANRISYVTAQDPFCLVRCRRTVEEGRILLFYGDGIVGMKNAPEGEFGPGRSVAALRMTSRCPVLLVSVEMDTLFKGRIDVRDPICASATDESDGGGILERAIGDFFLESVRRKPENWLLWEYDEVFFRESPKNGRPLPSFRSADIVRVDRRAYEVIRYKKGLYLCCKMTGITIMIDARALTVIKFLRKKRRIRDLESRTRPALEKSLVYDILAKLWKNEVLVLG
jgi:hypothetical protein